MKKFIRPVLVVVINSKLCSDDCLLLHGGYCIAEGKSLGFKIDLKLDGNTEKIFTYRKM